MSLPVSTVIDNWVRAGWTLEASTPEALVFLGKRPNHVLHGILSCVIPFYFIVWIVIAANSTPLRQTVAVKDGMVAT